MEYKITKEELGNDWLFSSLVALEKCMAKHASPLYIVGARARDIAMKRRRLIRSFSVVK